MISSEKSIICGCSYSKFEAVQNLQIFQNTELKRVKYYNTVLSFQLDITRQFSFQVCNLRCKLNMYYGAF
ncbi:unnamed protein product [Paramecium octaurelia]|uniref:Uncharacterized protein n=1 Tax=Paramecium octaurelia TaxID=43137 RepID=A0A8S1WQN9_PAROT|nr:unnamed protein product [Paramecium octaurelia]